MGDQVRADAAVNEVHQVKPWCARGKREIGDADNIPVGDAVAMLFEGIERTPQQTGIYVAVETRCLSQREPGSRGRGGKTGEGKIDKITAGKYQDMQLQHL